MATRTSLSPVLQDHVLETLFHNVQQVMCYVTLHILVYWLKLVLAWYLELINSALTSSP